MKQTRRIKQITGTSLLLALFLGLFGCKGIPMRNNAPLARDCGTLTDNLTFAVFSDPHYYDTDLGTMGKAFDAYIAQDRKLIRESDAITAAVVDTMISDGTIDFVLVPGDLTKDGERSSHVEFAGYLQTLEAAGINVYVVPGNHDINNVHAFAYADDKVTPTDFVTPQQFTQIYAAFGYSEAIARDPDSLSYVAEPCPGVWLIAMDSCKYADNERLGFPVISGAFSDATLTWIQRQLAAARKQGKQVIGMMHHGILEHFKGQSQVDAGKDYVIDDWETVSGSLAAAGLSVVFTGHYHAQDITTRTWEKDGRTWRLTDVETGSLLAYPCPFRKIVWKKTGEMSIETHYIETVTYPTEPLDFQKYAKEYLETGLTGIINYTLTLPKDKGGYGLSKDRAIDLTSMIVDAYMAHYAGDETPSVDHLAVIEKFESSQDPVISKLGQSIHSLWTDLAPEDRNVTIHLGR